MTTTKATATEAMTPTRHRALEIVKANPGLSAKSFAEQMWPDSLMHTRVSPSGAHNGACKGKAAWLAAGSYLSRLEKDGLVDKTYPDNRSGGVKYRLTTAGRKALEGK